MAIFKFLFVVMSTCNYIMATTVEEKKQEYAALILECAQQHAVPAEDIAMLQNKIMPDSRPAKCLFACAYKKSGMMDDQGYLSVESVLQISREIYADDAAKIQKAIEFTAACKFVNYEPVTDGAEGCDRAALIFKCSVDKAVQFDFAT